MPRPCSICIHHDREAMEAALTQSTPYRIIAARFGTSPAALQRHQQTHATPPSASVPVGVPTSEAAPPTRTPALVDVAHRVHATADLVQRQTRELRSIHGPELLERLEDLANVLVDVTSLLVVMTTAPRE